MGDFPAEKKKGESWKKSKARLSGELQKYHRVKKFVKRGGYIRRDAKKEISGWRMR